MVLGISQSSYIRIGANCLNEFVNATFNYLVKINKSLQLLTMEVQKKLSTSFAFLINAAKKSTSAIV